MNDKLCRMRPPSQYRPNASRNHCPQQTIDSPQYGQTKPSTAFFKEEPSGRGESEGQSWDNDSLQMI